MYRSCALPLLALACALPAYSALAAAPLPAVASFFETPRIDLVSLSPKGEIGRAHV